MAGEKKKKTQKKRRSSRRCPQTAAERMGMEGAVASLRFAPGDADFLRDVAVASRLRSPDLNLPADNSSSFPSFPPEKPRCADVRLCF